MIKKIRKVIINKGLLLGLVIASFTLSGCSFSLMAKYPRIITNQRIPLVSISYEFGEIEMVIPLEYVGLDPGRLTFEVYTGDSASQQLLVSVTTDPPNVMPLFLPQGTLDFQNPNNTLVIKMSNEDFDPLTLPFTGVKFGELRLPPILIEERRLIFTGRVRERSGESPIPDLDVSILNFGSIINTVYTDSTGNYKLPIPGRYKYVDDLSIIAGSDYQFAPARKRIQLPQTEYILDIGPSAELISLGNMYIIKKDQTHFRYFPHAGSNSSMLIGRGEVLAGQKVTGDRVYGFIEAEIGSGELILIDGWVDKLDLNLFLDGTLKDAHENRY